MRMLASLTIILAIALAACAGQVRQASGPEAIMATETLSNPGGEVGGTSPPEPTEEPTPSGLPTEEAGEAVTPEAGSASGGIVQYVLVPDQSTVTYEVGETFIDRGNVFNLAVGVTEGVTGEIQLNFDQLQDTTFSPLSVDISGFRSDSPRRDGAIRDRFLQSSRYPTVTFIPTAIEGLPEKVEASVEYPITLQGDLTIRETTRPATFQAFVRLEDQAISGRAETTFLMSDYGFGPIEILGILNTQDEIKIRVDFVARAQ